MCTDTMSEAQPFIEETRPAIRSLPRYNAGLSIDYVRSHYKVDTIAKLGSNENPYGPSPLVIEALRQAVSECSIYPEASCDPLRLALAGRLSVAPARLIFGNGSEDLIAVITHTFLSAGDTVVTFAPSFGLHLIWPESVGATVKTVSVNADYQMDVEDVLAALTSEPRLLIFGNPSNPVGSSLTTSDFERILAALTPKTLFVFDEAYLEYASVDPSYPDFFRMLHNAGIPWLILRTFSKAYGLAGLRIGYAVASDAGLIDLMDRVRAPFNVNRLAQTAALAALDDFSYVEKIVALTVRERQRMQAELTELGYRIAPSLANFLFVQAREDAGELANRLLTKGVIVKPWREAGFRDHLRVSIGTHEANGQFLSAWKQLAK